MDFNEPGATFAKDLDAGNNLIGVKVTHTVAGQLVTDQFTNFENFNFNGVVKTLTGVFTHAPVAVDDSALTNEDTP